MILRLTRHYSSSVISFFATRIQNTISPRDKNGIKIYCFPGIGPNIVAKSAFSLADLDVQPTALEDILPDYKF